MLLYRMINEYNKEVRFMKMITAKMRNKEIEIIFISKKDMPEYIYRLFLPKGSLEGEFLDIKIK